MYFLPIITLNAGTLPKLWSSKMLGTNELDGTLYIGFPKSYTVLEIESLLNEISDYIGNNNAVTLDILNADADYADLVFQQSPVDITALNGHEYRTIFITDVFQTTSIHIKSVDLEDAADRLLAGGFMFDELNNIWQKA